MDARGEGPVGGVEGVLQVGRVETPFARAGRGPALLLLRDGRTGQPARFGILGGLAARFRVTAAAAPLVREAEWLRGLIDGLGLDRPIVVADRSLGPFLAEFAAGHPERIGAVALVEEGDGDREEDAVARILRALRRGEGD